MTKSLSSGLLNACELNIAFALEAAKQEKVSPRMEICRKLGNGEISYDQAVNALKTDKSRPQKYTSFTPE